MRKTICTASIFAAIIATLAAGVLIHVPANVWYMDCCQSLGSFWLISWLVLNVVGPIAWSFCGVVVLVGIWKLAAFLCDKFRGAAMNNANGSKRQGKATSSRFKGVFFHSQTGKWCAQICNNGVKRHIGLFREEVDAALAYNLAAEETFGEFARVNAITGN